MENAFSTLLEEVLDIMPKNMKDYNAGHQRKIEDLLKLDNDDVPINQVKFVPRHRRKTESA
jgi:hypothetical protein